MTSSGSREAPAGKGGTLSNNKYVAMGEVDDITSLWTDCLTCSNCSAPMKMVALGRRWHP
eukprot:1850696-Amphidinium_carterae.2